MFKSLKSLIRKYVANFFECGLGATGQIKRSIEAERSLININSSIKELKEEQSFCFECIGKLLKNQKDAQESLGKVLENQKIIQDLFEGVLQNQRIGQGSLDLLTRNIYQESNSKKIRLGFLVHNIEAWGGIEPIYKAALKDSLFEPVVFSLNRKYSGTVYRDEDKISNILTAKGISHIRLNDKDSFKDLGLLKLRNINALFRQSHWISDLPPAFDPKYLSFANLYYLSYGLAAIPKQAFDFRYSLYEELCSKTFLLSQKVKEEMDRLHNSTRVVSMVTGHPKVNALLSAKPSWPIQSGNTVRIIWSCHHSLGAGWNDFGVFDKVFKELLALAKDRSDWDILFSPHPALVHRLDGLNNAKFGEGEGMEVSEFFKEWNGLNNTGTIEMGDYFGPFHSSTMLIADGLSFLCEYQLLEKPILWLSRKDSSSLSEFGERVMKGVHRLPIDRIQDLEKEVCGLLDNPDPLKAMQEVLKRELTEIKHPELEILNVIKADFIH